MGTLFGQSKKLCKHKKIHWVYTDSNSGREIKKRGICLRCGTPVNELGKA